MAEPPPGERPDFEPPEGQPPLAHVPDPPSPEPVADQPPAPPEWQPPAGVPQPAPGAQPPWVPQPGQAPQPPQGRPPAWPPPSDVPVQHHDVLPPGPYKQPWVPPRPRRQPLGRGSILLGMAISLGSLAIAWWLTISSSSTGALANLTGGAILIVPLVLLVVGIVLAALPKSTRTGAGILLGLGASVLIAAGLCFALLAQYSG